MPIKYLFIILPILFCKITQPELILRKEIDLVSDYAVSDQFGNFYAIAGSQIIKLNLDNTKEESFSSILNGAITSVDASDPFRILLFLKDFNKIIFLNKDLSEITSPINLNDLGFFDVATACQSVNGGFWIFDQSSDQLIYINKNLVVTKKSSHLTELVDQNIELSQILLIEKNDYIYLGINGGSIMLFDNYGTYIKTFPLNYNKTFQVNNDIISFAKEDKLCFYNSQNYNENCIVLPFQDFKQVLIENTNLFVQTNQKIYIYQYTNF